MKRFQLVIETAITLYFCAAVASLALLAIDRHLTLSTAGLALTVPSIATVCFVLLGLAIPELYAVGAMRFPLNLTLPVIYVALMLLTVVLLTRIGVAIRRIPDDFEALAVWANGWLDLLTLAAGITVFSWIAALGKKDAQR